MTDPARLLAAYDEQLRTEAEVAGSRTVERLGPLWLAVSHGGSGFITYRDLGDADATAVRGLVAEAQDWFRSDPTVAEVEWKTRGHDAAPGLHEALLEHGFAPEEPESIMVGEARALAVDVALPPGVTLRRVSEPDDIRAMSRMTARAFGRPEAEQDPESLVRHSVAHPETELWVAEAGGEMVSAGRLQPVRGSEFAGIWGGGTLPEWRGRGIYRALTAARARSALRLGKRLVHSDSTAYSRPILERSGLVKVSTTTPYTWRP